MTRPRPAELTSVPLEEEPVAAPGKVYLVGAGPGDPGLITLRGLEALRSSQVVVYDRLVPRELLRRAPGDAERIHVGKSPGHAAYSQKDINRLLIDRARSGHTVCRLKGGDPFIFGRGGEEALALAQAGIPFEVIPGVTAGVAGPASAGIPLTQRGLASSVVLVTGHEDPTKPGSQVNWEALARTAGTIVVYMGVGRLAEIVDALIGAGCAPETPAALVASATLPTQRSATATLATIVEEARRAGLGPPAVLVVGEVVRLRERLAWFEKRPLFGRRVVVTRAREVAHELSEPLRQLGAEVLEVPAIRLVAPADPGPLREALERAEEFDWIVFTSARAVERFFDELLRLRGDVRVLAGVRLAAIGVVTARAIERYHLAVDLYPSEFVAEAVLGEFARRGRLTGRKLLLPRAAGARPLLPEGLQEMGAEVTEVELYRSEPDPDQDPETLTQLAHQPPDLITFASPSAVRGFERIVPRETWAEICRCTPAVVIGPVTAEAAQVASFKVARQASPHTIAALVDAVAKHLSKPAQQRPEGPAA